MGVESEAGEGRTTKTDRGRPKGAGDVAVRGARAEDYPAVRELILSVWEDPDDELGIWDYTTANDPDLRPEHTRLVVAAGRPVATATLLPRRVRTPRGWVPGAELTLVACHPEHRGRGFGRTVVRDAFRFMASRGMAVAVFHGEPDFYLRLGCAPVFASVRAELEAAAFGGELVGAGRPALAEPGEDDASVLASVYADRVGVYPGSVARAPEAWVWRVRNRRFHSLFVLEDRRGYSFVSFGREGDGLLVREAAAVDERAAGDLLGGLVREARSRGRSSVVLAVPFDNLLPRLAFLLGAEKRLRPARTGFAAVTRWEPLLPAGYEVREDSPPEFGADGEVELRFEGRCLLRCRRSALTQLVMGYRSVDDLSLLGECRPCPLPDRERSMLRADFPVGLPHYSEAPYLFWL